MYEIDQIYVLRGKSRDIPYFFGEIPGLNFRLIPSQKILGSWDFAKSRPGNLGLKILDLAGACCSHIMFMHAKF